MRGSWVHPQVPGAPPNGPRHCPNGQGPPHLPRSWPSRSLATALPGTGDTTAGVLESKGKEAKRTRAVFLQVYAGSRSAKPLIETPARGICWWCFPCVSLPRKRKRGGVGGRRGVAGRQCLVRVFARPDPAYLCPRPGGRIWGPGGSFSIDHNR